MIERPVRKEAAQIDSEDEEEVRKPNPLLAGISAANPNMNKKQDKMIKVASTSKQCYCIHVHLST